VYQSSNTLTYKKLLTDSELDELWMFLKRENRDQLIIELALLTGARASELLSLRADDFSVEESEVYIKASKNSNDRSLPIPKALLVAIVDQALPGKPVFPISYDRLYQVWQHFKPGPKKFHSLRHTFATKLYDKTKDIRLVQIALGHKAINNTLIYAAFVDSKKKMKGALNGLY
jgi:integrase